MSDSRLAGRIEQMYIPSSSLTSLVEYTIHIVKFHSQVCPNRTRLGVPVQQGMDEVELPKLRDRYTGTDLKHAQMVDLVISKEG